MTNTTTQSGQRPPNATRPTDAELGRVLDAAAMTIHRLARLVVPEVAEDARNVRDRVAAAADALDAAPARLTPEQWQEAVERMARHLEKTSVRIHWGDNSDARNRAEYNSRANAALRACFPHLAPNPED